MTTGAPQTSNQDATKVATVVNSSVDSALQVGMKLLFADFTWLALPGLKQIVEIVFRFIGYYVSKGLSQVAAFSVIDTQINVETQKFSVALEALKSAQASGDANAIQTALKNFQDAAVALGNYDGSVNL